MSELKVTAEDDVNLGTVSGSALNNSLTTFDAINVGGDLIATVISLGNNAVVTLADGDNVFSALGSAGKDITITAGDGDNIITGSAQDDNITTGAGWDIVIGDRGDNVIETAGGDDTIFGKDGNDTYDVGSGNNLVLDNLGTGIDASLATNTVSMNNGTTSVLIDVDGSLLTGFEVDQALAVGEGSNLTISWMGANMQTGSASLDGRLAQVDTSPVAATMNGDANNNLFILDGNSGAAGVKTVNGGDGNDVGMWVGSTATDGLVFNGGKGNDAAVGSIGSDVITGGAGADQVVLQNSTIALDGRVDTVVVLDGESTATARDTIVGFDTTAGPGAPGVPAGSNTFGSDVLDLPSASIAAATPGTDGTDAGEIESHAITANGLVTFDTDDTYGLGTLPVVGIGTGQLKLEDAVSYLATNLNGTSDTVAFQYDSNGDGLLTAVDSTFVFQDGAEDTLIELIGLYNGLEAVGGGTLGLIEIA
jgi:hypothetical protein